VVAADWVIIAVLVLSVVVAAAQGFFFEMFSLAGVVFGYLFAAWEYWRLAPWFQKYVNSAAAANIAAFWTIFVFVCIIAGIAGKITRWAMKEVGLRWADRLLGGAFGLVRGVAAVSIAVLVLATFYPDSGLMRGSQLGRYFLFTARAASWVAPSDVRHMFHDGVNVWRATELIPSGEKNTEASNSGSTNKKK
jgi:membrane protein required for colicin V production